MKKKLYFCTWMVIMSGWMTMPIVAQTTTTAPVLEDSLLVVIDGIEEQKGNVYVKLCNADGTGFGALVPAKSETVEYTFQYMLDPGQTTDEVRIMAFHDANDNKSFDRNFLGIPKEKYGFSHNVQGMFGMPSFEETKISIPETRVVRIHLRYHMKD